MAEASADMTREYVTVVEVERRKRAVVESLVELVECGGRLIAEVELYAVEVQKGLADLEALGEGRS